MTYDRASETNFIQIKNNTDGLKYTDILGITGSSSLNTFDLLNYQYINMEIFRFIMLFYCLIFKDNHHLLINF